MELPKLGRPPPPTAMVTGAAPGKLKLMRWSPACQFASMIAARSEHWPCASAQMPLPCATSGVSAVLLTTNGPVAATTADEAP